MGRRLRPLDPEAGVAARFACELRALRAMAGDPPFWKMARRCEVSKSALAAAVGGRALPTEHVVRAFVEVCRGDWAWWQSRLQHFRELAAAPAEDSHEVVGTGQDLAILPTRIILRDPEPESAGYPAWPYPSPSPFPSLTENGIGADTRMMLPSEPESRTTRFRRRLISATALVEALVIAGLAVALATDRPGPDPRLTASAKPQTPIDGADPYTDGCGADEQAIQREGIVWSNQQTYGWLTLYYSHKCDAAWGSVSGPNSPQWRVFIVAHRPQDGASAPSSFSGDSARPGSWGNVLLTGRGCVWVEAYLQDQNGRGQSAKTDCYQESNGPVLHGATGTPGG